MPMVRQNRKFCGELILAMAVSALTALVAFVAAGQAPGGGHVYLLGDAYAQYMEYIVMYWRGILSGSGVTYSFDIGLGAPVWAHYAFYALSPCNVVFLLVKDVDTACFVLYLLKVALAAGAFYYFEAVTLRREGAVAVGFAVCYALCGYMVNFHYGIPLLEPVYLLPLVVAATVRFVDSGRAWWLCVVYAYSFTVWFYGGYMLGVFSLLLYLGLRLIRRMERCGADNGPREVAAADAVQLVQAGDGPQAAGAGGTAGRYVRCVLTAAAISAVVTLPTAAALVQNIMDPTAAGGRVASPADVLRAFYIGQGIQATDTVPAVYAGVLSLLLAAVFLADRDVSRRHRLAAALGIGALLAFTLWRPAYLLIHGLDEPNGYDFRFAWAYSFLLLSMAAWEAGRWRHALAGRARVAALVIAGICPLALWGSGKWGDGAVRAWCVNAAFLLAYVLMLGGRAAVWDRCRGLLVGMLCVVEVGVNAFMLLRGDAAGDDARRRLFYETWQEQTVAAISEVEAMEADEGSAFMRIHLQGGLFVNDSMLFGCHGLGYFSSLEQPRLREALQSLGYGASPRMVMDAGSTPLMRMLLAQRYTVVEKDDASGGVVAEVGREARTLPLGYMVSADILRCSLDDEDAFGNQNALLSAMLGHRADVYRIYDGEVDVLLDGALLSETEAGHRLERDTALPASEAAMALYYMADDDGASLMDAAVSSKDAGAEVAAGPAGNGEGMAGSVDGIGALSASDAAAFYGYITVPSVHMSTNSPLVYTVADDGRIGHMLGSNLTVPRIFKLGEEPGQRWIGVWMTAEAAEEAEYRDVYFARSSPEALERAYAELAPGGMEVSAFRDTCIEARVRTEGAHPILFTSIPYDDGWHVYVDGVEAETLPLVDGAFLGCVLTAGEHDLRIVYRNRYLAAGLCVSLGGLLLLACGWAGTKYNKGGGSGNGRVDCGEVEKQRHWKGWAHPVEDQGRAAAV